jgi:hypothetical protein
LLQRISQTITAIARANIRPESRVYISHAPCERCEVYSLEGREALENYWSGELLNVLRFLTYGRVRRLCATIAHSTVVNTST